MIPLDSSAGVISLAAGLIVFVSAVVASVILARGNRHKIEEETP